MSKMAKKRIVFAVLIPSFLEGMHTGSMADIDTLIVPLIPWFVSCKQLETFFCMARHHSPLTSTFLN